VDPLEGKLQEVDPDWMAAVYEALSHEREFLDVDELTDKLFAKQQTEEYQIGEAFEQALVVNLPDSLLRWDGIPLPPRVSEEYRADLLKTPSVQASRYATEFLSLYGMTPLSVLWTTEAVGGLIERLIRKQELNREQLFGVKYFFALATIIFPVASRGLLPARSDVIGVWF
jgi:hypothetical protein